MDPVYKAIVFNVEKPDNPKTLIIQSLVYESLKNGWSNEIVIGKWVYAVERCRAFSELSEIFGARNYLVLDVKRNHVVE